MKAFLFHFSLLELQKPTLAGPWQVTAGFTKVTGQKEEKKEKEKMKLLRTDGHMDQSNVVQEVLADPKR